VTWDLGLKKWLKSRGRWHNTEKNSPWTLAYHVVGVSRAIWTHACPYQGSVCECNGLKNQWDLGAGYLSGYEGSW